MQEKSLRVFFIYITYFFHCNLDFIISQVPFHIEIVFIIKCYITMGLLSLNRNRKIPSYRNFGHYWVDYQHNAACLIYRTLGFNGLCQPDQRLERLLTFIKIRKVWINKKKKIDISIRLKINLLYQLIQEFSNRTIYPLVQLTQINCKSQRRKKNSMRSNIFKIQIEYKYFIWNRKKIK